MSDEDGQQRLKTEWEPMAEAMRKSTGTFARLCRFCQQMFDVSPSTGEYETSGDHHDTADKCLGSATSGCPICVVVWRHATRDDHKYERPAIDVDLGDKGFTSYRITYNDSDAYSIAHWPADTLLLKINTGKLSSARGLSVIHAWMHESVYFGFFPVDDSTGDVVLSTSGESGVARPIESPSTDSEESWNIIRGWLAKCTKNHQCISENFESVDRDAEYPSRLLEVGDFGDDSIRVRKTSELEKMEPYITLSHCWGSGPGKSHFRLLDMSQNHDARGNFVSLDQDSIAVASMPKTFRDAVQATRKLGKKFLWIDSLCIVQNSEGAKDWLKESLKMFDIYAKSYCTLTSDGSPDSDGGLFLERNATSVDPLIISKHGSGSEDTPNTYVLMYSGFWKDAVSNSNVGRRAWTLQERYLAPAMVHFGKEQLFFECEQFEACETFPAGLPSFASETSIRFKSHSEQDAAKLRSQVQSKPDEQDEGAAEPDASLDLYYTWSRLVEKYMQTKLTFDSDRLVAIHALGRAFSSRMNDLNVAGLMWNILPSQLVWRTDNDRKSSIFYGEDQTPKVNLPLARRPQGRRPAPTWSWASVVGSVIMPNPLRDTALINAQIFLFGDRPEGLSDLDRATTEKIVGYSESTMLRIHGRLHFGILSFNPSATVWGVEIGTQGYGSSSSFTHRFDGESSAIDAPRPSGAEAVGDDVAETVATEAFGAHQLLLEYFMGRLSQLKKDLKSDDGDTHARGIVHLDAEEYSRLPQGMSSLPVYCLPIIDTQTAPKNALQRVHQWQLGGVSGLLLIHDPEHPGIYQRFGVFDLIEGVELKTDAISPPTHKKLFYEGDQGIILLA